MTTFPPLRGYKPARVPGVMPQGVTMMILENKIPPPIVAVIFGILMWCVSDGLSDPREIGMVRVAAIFLAILVGALFCLSGVMAFRSAKTTVNPLKPESASSLVKSGIYRFSRNPMYVGFALFLVSWAFYLGSNLTMFGVLGFVLFITRYQILPEERAMIALFGDEFKEYSKTVRRWL